MKRVAPLFALALATGCPDGPPGPGGPWTSVSTGLREALLSVAGTSATDVWAVGADKGQGPIVLHFDGTTWTRRPTGQRGHLWWVQPFADGTAIMGGGSTTLLRWNGAAFERMATPGVASHTIFGVWGAAPDDVYAVGSVSTTQRLPTARARSWSSRSSFTPSNTSLDRSASAAPAWPSFTATFLSINARISVDDSASTARTPMRSTSWCRPKSAAKASTSSSATAW